jgi:hypothetical protein
VSSANGELGFQFLVEDLHQRLEVAPLTLIHSADSLSDTGTSAAYSIRERRHRSRKKDPKRTSGPRLW